MNKFPIPDKIILALSERQLIVVILIYEKLAIMSGASF